MSLFTQRKSFLLVPLLLLCLCISACGNASASPASTSTQTATRNLSLRICQINTSINFFPFYVAQQKGYFAAQRLTVNNPPLLQTGSKVVDAIEGGNCDIGNGVMTDAFTWAKVDPAARILGAFMNGFVVDIVVSKKFEQEMHVSASSPLANKIKALRGKTIAITGPNTGTSALVTYLFRLEGMDAAKDVTEVSLGSNNAAALAALAAGRVDALSFFMPIGQAAEARGVGDIFISPVRGDIPGLRGDVHGVFYTTQSIINAKPQAIAAYIRAINQAEQFIQSNPSEAKTLLNQYLGLGQSVTDAVYTAASAGIATSPTISQAAYNVAGQFHVQAGLIKSIPPYCQLVATSTTDNALGIKTNPCQS